MDSFLTGFEDCCMKVLKKYSDIDLSGISSIDISLTPQVAESPSASDVGAPTAPIGEDDAIGD